MGTLGAKLAEIVMAAQRIREQGYDGEAADAAYKAGEVEREANPHDIYAGLVDFQQFYRCTMLQAAKAACKQAGEPELETPVYLLCECGWNDAQMWAAQTVAQDHAG